MWREPRAQPYTQPPPHSVETASTNAQTVLCTFLQSLVAEQVCDVRQSTEGFKHAEGNFTLDPETKRELVKREGVFGGLMLLRTCRSTAAAACACWSLKVTEKGVAVVAVGGDGGLGEVEPSPGVVTDHKRMHCDIFTPIW